MKNETRRQKLKDVNKAIYMNMKDRELVQTVSSLFQELKPFVDKEIQKGKTPNEAIMTVLNSKYVQIKHGRTFKNSKVVRYELGITLRSYYYNKHKKEIANEEFEEER